MRRSSHWKAVPLVFVLAACLFVALAERPETALGGEAGVERRRLFTSRSSEVELALPSEEDSFVFAVFGDRTGGPREGVRVLAQAVEEVKLLGPDLVMTVGDLVEGYNTTAEWMVEMREFQEIMDRLDCPWFPVAGNHDVYWRGPEGQRPEGEHEASYEAHFGPLWYAFRHKSAWFVALYSDEGDPATGRKSFNDPAAQRMSPEQYAWLAETLERAREADHVFVFLHHPRWLGGNYGDDWERVHALLAGAGNVTAVFAGHIHRMRYDGARDGIEYFTLATVGGGQSGLVPDAGFLHQYHFVTVRRDGIDVTCYPVGSAMDPRRVTGEISDEARGMAGALRPRFEARARLEADLGVDGGFELAFTNPGARPLELFLAAQSDDSRWRFAPGHQHRILAPGATERFALRVLRGAGELDEAFREPELTVRAEIHADGWRVPIPARTELLPLDLGALPSPPLPAEERALFLDGDGAHLRIEHAELALPDGPFTLEGWLCADEFRARQGFVNKTEGSEFGIFVNEGRVEFLAHLSGRYASAGSRTAVLAPGTWHHVAGVFDGAELRAYADGRLVATRRASGPRTRNELPLLVGADVGRAGRPDSPFSGLIDEVRLSRGARYAGERFEPARRLSADEDTVLLFHMDGAAGPWHFDASPRRAHARALGGARLVTAGG